MTKEKNKDSKFSNLLLIASLAREMRANEAKKATTLLQAEIIAKRPLNDFIREIYGLANKELNTFKKWVEKGYKVKKGEKGYLFFSAPKLFKKEVETKDGNKEEIDYSRFCKCFLFSSDQVEKI